MVSSPTYWLNGEGSWSVQVTSVSAGECAKPSGTKFVGSFLAKPKEVTEEETDFDDSSSSGDSVFDNTLLIGGISVILLIAGIKKIRNG